MLCLVWGGSFLRTFVPRGLRIRLCQETKPNLLEPGEVSEDLRARVGIYFASTSKRRKDL